MHTTRRRRVTLTIILSILTALGGLALSGTANAGLLDGGCQRDTVPVALTPNAPTRYTLVAWLCGDRRSPGGGTVQVLVSGMTYDHRYWDLPYQPDQYSYVQTATRDHQTVFNIDRIGVGQSDHPAADQVTVLSEAYVTHQIVQALRQGRVGHTRFSKVVGVGHSLGSGIVTAEDGTYHDLDALVLTGLLHQGNTPKVTDVIDTLQPTAGDPPFSHQTMPAGYYTTTPGAATRLADFYQPGDADPAVVNLDNAFAATATSGELAGTADINNVAFSQQVRAPVLFVVGQDDALLCDPAQGLSCQTPADICARETPDFPAGANLAAYVVPDAGHSINLHYHANQWYTAAQTWIDHRFTAPSRASGSGRASVAQTCRA